MRTLRGSLTNLWRKLWLRKNLSKDHNTILKKIHNNTQKKILSNKRQIHAIHSISLLAATNHKSGTVAIKRLSI